MAMHSVVKSAPPPPYSSGNGQAEQPELAHGQHGVDRERVVAVPRLGVRRDLGFGEVAHHLAERLLLVGELEVHRRRSYGCGLERLARVPTARRSPSSAAGCCTDLVDVTADLAALDGTGHLGGRRSPSRATPVCARFATVRPAGAVAGPRRGSGRPPSAWTSSASTATAFEAGVSRHPRRRSRAGDVYQVNLTRRLSRAAAADGADVAALGAALAEGNPAPFTAVVRLPGHGVHVASASPERFLRRDGDRRARRRRSRAPPRRADGFLAEGPRRERDDRRPRPQRPRPGVRVGLGRRCRRCARSSRTPGSSTSCRTVTGRLRPGVGWADADRRHVPARARSPARRSSPRSTTSPRSSRVRAASYCGAVGWVDADAQRGRPQRRHPHVLVRRRRRSTSAPAAASRGTRRPRASGQETELKARRLRRVGERRVGGTGRERAVVGRRRARRRRRGRGRRRSTTGSPSATACSRR